MCFLIALCILFFCGFYLLFFLFDFYSTALQHVRSFRAQSVYLATLFPGKPPRQFKHSFASNWQMLFLNQREREIGCRNVFMTKSPWTNVPDIGIELGAACMPSEHASNQTTAPGYVLLNCSMYFVFPFVSFALVALYEPRHKKICFCHMRTTKLLIRLRRCAGWSAPLLFAA